jgi:hypothetical protein
MFESVTPSIISLLPISFPSLTHLFIIADPFTPSTISHLLLLKSLTDLQLTIRGCVEPKSVLLALQPLASVLTELDLDIQSTHDPIGSERADSGQFRANDGCYQMSYLLPFRSLTELRITILTTSSSSNSYITVRNTFMNQRGNELGLHATPLDLVCLLREFVSLSLLMSSLSTLPPTAASLVFNDSKSQEGDIRAHKKDSLFDIVWNGPTLDELNKFLVELENASLLIIPSSSLVPVSISSPPTYVPTISLTCRYDHIEPDVLRDMTDRIKSRSYTNMSSFTVRTSLNNENNDVRLHIQIAWHCCVSYR